MAWFVPDLIIDSVLKIDQKLLQKHKLKALLLDVDNTLTSHGNPEPYDGIIEWIAQMKKLGIMLVIISNNSHTRVKPFAESLGIDFISRGMKPLTIGYTKAMRQLGIKSNETAIVGDQIYTDILGGNIKGMMTILVEPFELEDTFFFKLKRLLERRHIRRYYKKLEKCSKSKDSDKK